MRRAKNTSTLENGLQDRGQQLLQNQGKRLVVAGAKHVLHEHVSGPVAQFVGDKIIDHVVDNLSEKRNERTTDVAQPVRKNDVVNPQPHQVSETDIHIIDELLEDTGFIALKTLVNIIKRHYSTENIYQLILTRTLATFLAQRSGRLEASLIEQATSVLDAFYTQLTVRQKRYAQSHAAPQSPMSSSSLSTAQSSRLPEPSHASQQPSVSRQTPNSQLPELTFALFKKASTPQARWAVLEATYQGNISGWMLGYQLVKKNNWLDLSQYLSDLQAFSSEEFNLKNRLSMRYDGKRTLIESILQSKEKPPCYVQMALLSSSFLNFNQIKMMALWPRAKEQMFSWIDTNEVHDQEQKLTYWQQAINLKHSLGRFFGTPRTFLARFTSNTDVTETGIAEKIQAKIDELNAAIALTARYRDKISFSEVQTDKTILSQHADHTFFNQNEKNDTPPNKTDDLSSHNESAVINFYPYSPQLYFLAASVAVLCIFLLRASCHQEERSENNVSPRI